jgi:hypothetical protein
MQIEQVGEDGRGQLGGELEHGGVAGRSRNHAEGAQADAQRVGGDVPAGRATGK